MFRKKASLPCKGLIQSLLHKTPRTRSELIKILYEAAQNSIIEENNIPLIEAVIRLDRLKAKDIMLPRHKIDVLDVNDEIDTLINKITTTKHSRFPVIEGDISNVLGIFHAKDLLNYFLLQDNFNLRDEIRQAYFVPELKQLDALMFEMRVRQTHMALIVDEFTNIVGLVTLEMIVEHIVGEIEDEHDLIDVERAIIKLTDKTYRLKGYCKINDLNLILESGFKDKAVETVGGYLIKYLGRTPVAHEIIDFEKFQIEIVDADSRKIKLLILKIK